jgi:cytochrome oxidase assembly protein ShyY1
VTSTRLDFRFAVRPIWLLGHFVLFASLVLFGVLGLWQLDRHRDRQDLDGRISARLVAEPKLLGELVATHGSDPGDLALRRVIVDGAYLTEDEVIWQARTRSGASGHDVLTPLQTQEGVIIVDRGWVPIDVDGPPVVGAEPPAGVVRVEGIILEGQTRGSFGPVDPTEGTLERISRVDLARLQRQVEGPLARFYVQLASQTPPQEGGMPLAQIEPVAGSGPPHLSYAVQWFVFAAVALVGYPILLWLTARRRG